MKIFFLPACAFALLLSSVAFAQAETNPVMDTPPAAASEQKPVNSVVMAKAPDAADVPVLQKIKQQSGKVDVEFDYIGNNSGADVWLISGDKIMQMINVLPSGAAIIGGTLIGADGQEQSSLLQKKFADEHHERAQKILERVRASLQKEEAATQAAAKNSAKDTANPAVEAKPAVAAQHPAITGDMVWNSMSKLGVVHYGAEKNAPIVYIVLDPMQPASQQAFKTLEPFADKKTLDLRVVPISLKSTDAIMQVALILGRSGAQESLKALMNGTKIETKEAPIPEGGLLVKNNADFVQALQLNTLPSLFYRKSETDPIRAVKGPPKDWGSVFKELGLQ